MSRSHELFERALRCIPGGVNSPVRAFRGVGGEPVFFERAEGAYLIDADGQRYTDYVGSWGPMILGHTDPAVLAAVIETAAHGLSFGAPCELEVDMAERITQLVPSIEQVRMVSSGTEATMSAIRLARGFTRRDLIVKFEGCYHGHADSLLVKAGSGALTLGQPTSPGVPASFAEKTLTLTYNDLDSVESAFRKYGKDIACIIVEPVAGNMNCIPPLPGFLEGLRSICDQYGSVLVFDEVMTGFRVALGGAQALYGIRPDLTTLGKVIGGGMPVGAFGGRADIMQYLAPVGAVYQAGTLSGNPVAMAAGLATLDAISAAGFFDTLHRKTRTLMDGIQQAGHDTGVPVFTRAVGGMFGIFFTTASSVDNYEQATACDTQRFQQFFHAMLDRGVYLAPSAFEAGFVSAAHSDADIAATINHARDAFNAMAS